MAQEPLHQEKTRKLRNQPDHRRASSLIGIHSFWSKPLLENRWGLKGTFEKSLTMTALSLATMKRVFDEVHLVTDTKGAELFKDLGYDQIHLDLDHLADLHPRYWSAGKIYALKRYEVPVVHVDGDVFFLKPEIRSFFDRDWDVAVQMKEAGEHYQKTYSHLIEKMQPALKSWGLDLYNFAYNCGVMGFKDLDFMQHFVEEYFRALRSCQQNQKAIDRIGLEYEINIVLEQALLTHISQNAGVYVRELITLEKQTFPGLQPEAERLGFVHLWGPSKYQPEWEARVEKRLLELDPETYFKIKR